MNVHEYQAKDLLSEYGVAVPPGEVATTPAEAEEVARRIGGSVVVKAQVHAGGRGKGGGIQLAKSASEAKQRAAEILGFKVHVSTPGGYEVDPKVAGISDTGCYRSFKDPLEACRGAHLVTTDVWTSMGYEAESAARDQAFANWCVDDRMMAAARSDALFMHCLPAHRGEEVASSVIDGPQSVVWDEAENRMHVQKALMEYLLLGRIG